MRQVTVQWLCENEETGWRQNAIRTDLPNAFIRIGEELLEVLGVYEPDVWAGEDLYLVKFVADIPALYLPGNHAAYLDDGTSGEGVPAASPVDDDAPDAAASEEDCVRELADGLPVVVIYETEDGFFLDDDDDVQASLTAEDESEMWDYVREVAAAQVARAEAQADRTPNILAPFNSALVHGVADNPFRALNQGELDRMRAVAREMAVWGVWDGFTIGIDIIHPQHVYDRVLMGGMRQAHVALVEGVDYRFVPVSDDILRATTPDNQKWRLPRLFGEVA